MMTRKLMMMLIALLVCQFASASSGTKGYLVTLNDRLPQRGVEWCIDRLEEATIGRRSGTLEIVSSLGSVTILGAHLTPSGLVAVQGYSDCVSDIEEEPIMGPQPRVGIGNRLLDQYGGIGTGKIIDGKPHYH